MPWLSANLHRALAVAVIATASVLSSPAGVQAAPRVVVTVDVESNDSFPLPRQAEAVCKDGSACGLMEVARLLRTRGLAGTFFLNVYEYPRWGESAIRDIAVKLQAAGQDVGPATVLVERRKRAVGDRVSERHDDPCGRPVEDIDAAEPEPVREPRRVGGTTHVGGMISGGGDEG